MALRSNGLENSEGEIEVVTSGDLPSHGQQREWVTVLGATEGTQKIKDICYRSRHPQVPYSKVLRVAPQLEEIGESCHRGPQAHICKPQGWWWLVV